jgi:hypothetical protein
MTRARRHLVSHDLLWDANMLLNSDPVCRWRFLYGATWEQVLERLGGLARRQRR